MLKQYTQVCSEKTLQANSEGFFLQFAEAVTKEVGKKWVNEVFGKLITDGERIRFVYEDPKIKQHVFQFLSNVQEVYRAKNLQVAQEKFLTAEAFRHKNDYVSAITYYSQSILKAPITDELYFHAFFGRLKCLILLEKFKNAIIDIQSSLKLNLENSIKGELFAWLSLSYKALNENSKAQVALNLAKQLIPNSNKIKKILKQNFKATTTSTDEKNSPKISDNRNVNFQCASKKLRLESSQEKGRFFIAADEIQTGEILIVEPAAVSCLLPEKFGTHCHHCFERLIAPVGCPDCSSVAFCTPECRKLALNTYHRFECKFLDLIIGSGMSILSQTALRMITQHSPQNILKMYENSRASKDHSLYKLCTNSEKRSANDFLHRTLMAAFLLRCLQKSGYFESADLLPTTEQFKIGEIILFNLQILQFNAHEIFETLYLKGSRLTKTRPSYIGIAIYPTAALLNHDCYPSVTRYFCGKNIVIHATKPIKTREVVAENYGPIFTLKNLDERQQGLMGRYWFECQCLACVENWPLLSQLNVPQQIFRCSNMNCSYKYSEHGTSTACPRCNSKLSFEENIGKLRWCEQQYKDGLGCLEIYEKDKAVTILSKAVDSFHSIAAPPHRETHLVQEALRVCFADNGNSFECPNQK